MNRERHGKRWTESEMSAALDAYLGMLNAQEKGTEVRPDQVIERLLGSTLAGRTHEAVRRRFCNITSLFADRGWPQVDGFNRLSHVGANQEQVLLSLLSERGFPHNDTPS